MRECDSSEHWPLVLAGVIVRRVEPGIVAVWVALEGGAFRSPVGEAGGTDAGVGTGLFSGAAPLVTGDDPGR